MIARGLASAGWRWLGVVLLLGGLAGPAVAQVVHDCDTPDANARHFQYPLTYGGQGVYETDYVFMKLAPPDLGGPIGASVLMVLHPDPVGMTPACALIYRRAGEGFFDIAPSDFHPLPDQPEGSVGFRIPFQDFDEEKNWTRDGVVEFVIRDGALELVQ